MKMRRLCSTAPISAALILLAMAAPGAQPAERVLTVSQQAGAQFSSVQAAIDSLPPDNVEPAIIDIAPGVYQEVVRVPKGKRFVTLSGEDAALTILTFDNAATKKRPDGTLLGTSGSASTFVAADDFTARGVSFENSAAPRKQVGQALALSVSGDRCAFFNCRFLGWQDTLYTGGRGRQYFQDCTIEGDVDFIFGYSAAVFERCRIHSRAAGYITAHARTSAGEPTGYVFRNCELTGDAPPSSVSLGRPWRPYARVVFLNCSMGVHIRPEGWDNWSRKANESTAWFTERNSTGKGASPQARAAWSRQLSAAEAAVFEPRLFLAGADNWSPQLARAATAASEKAIGKPIEWKQALRQKPEWYGSAEAARIADNVLRYQRANGGWEKNVDMTAELSPAEQAALEVQEANVETTIDNGATYSQLQFLARVHSARARPEYGQAFLKGLDFLLTAQYPNGGWPQFFPLKKGYYSHITFNDDAMIGVLNLLHAIAQREPAFAFVDEPRRARCDQAVAKGIECILRCQVTVGGRLTVWCAQHDEKSLAPAWARKFEPPSLSGGESVAITRFLMGIDKPNARVIQAIQSAIGWFEGVRIPGLQVLEQPAPGTPKGHDTVAIPDAKAPPIWARFYEIGSNRPIFLGRDSVVRYRLADIEYERRNGYAYYVTSPRKLLEQDYPAWLKKWAPEKGR